MGEAELAALDNAGQQAGPQPAVVQHRQGRRPDHDDAEHGGAPEEARLQAGIHRERRRAYVAQLARLSVSIRAAIVSRAPIVDQLHRPAHECTVYRPRRRPRCKSSNDGNHRAIERPGAGPSRTRLWQTHFQHHVAGGIRLHPQVAAAVANKPWRTPRSTPGLSGADLIVFDSGGLASGSDSEHPSAIRPRISVTVIST